MNKGRLILLCALVFAFAVSTGCGTKETVVAGSSTSSAAENVNNAAVAIEASAVYFAFDRYDLDDTARQVLVAKAQALKDYKNIHVTVEGHCDQYGTEEYNLALGERRAKAVYDYLVMNGVAPAQLSFVSYGKLYPASSANTPEGWSLNRRTEFNASIK